MKIFKLIVLPLISILSFCSCQKEAEKLCWGYFDVDSDASYVVKNNKRHYVSELDDENAISSLRFGGESKKVKVFYKNGGAKESKIFFDEDCFIVDGETYRIIESSPQTLVFESYNKETENVAHLELIRDKNHETPFLGKLMMKYVYYEQTVPKWIRSIIFIIAIGIIIFLVSKIKDDTVRIVVAIICALVFLFFVYLAGACDGGMAAMWHIY